MCEGIGFVPAASQDWGLGFGPVTMGRERAQRAPELWLPPPNLEPQSWRASKEGLHRIFLIHHIIAHIYSFSVFRVRVLGLGSGFWGFRVLGF